MQRESEPITATATRPRRIRRFERALLLNRRAPAGVVERGAFWLTLLFVASLLLSYLPGSFSDLFTGIAVLAAITLFVFLLILLYRWIFNRLLWTVRNRLVLTCLLMGLAPIVLFGLLTGLAAYIFAGQFATNTARAAIDATLARVHISSTVTAAPLLHQVSVHPAAPGFVLPVITVDRGSSPTATPSEIAAWDGDRRIQLIAPPQPSLVQPASFSSAPPPAWLHDGFNGIVEIDGSLFLCSADGAGDNRHSLLIVATAPLNAGSLSRIALGLGNISILSAAALAHAASSEQGFPSEPPGKNGPVSRFKRVQGGDLAPAAHFFDARVVFSAPLQITAWSTGRGIPGLLGVVSRPTLLYRRLFSASVQIGAIVQDILIAVAIFFGILELLALFMAVRLSRTITASIADLYKATIEIDRGHFDHRIQVARKDQLAALATSFNVMTGSLQDLLEQQREKERIQSELAIAQEVQNNLFPHSPVLLPGFELHGICKPARTVSGDYYDFILSPGACSDTGSSPQLCLAIGDISGKGISAALLMASLHSAVRAYHSAEYPPGPDTKDIPVPTSLPQDRVGADTSPARLLSLLNRHLYASTQPSKYATLFLACYDCATCRLTYSNGGQLPPFILCANGGLRRLDCGGSVVGLLDNLNYQQATVPLNPGDLFIAYSDGVTEPENDFGEFGEDRLLDLIRQHRHLSLAAISDHTMRALQSWIGEAEQPDDITLVLGRRL